MTAFHRKIRNEQRADESQDVQNTDTTLFPLTPGVSLNFTIDLVRLYRITDPGTYTVEISEVDENSKTTVHAEPISLRIAPQNARSEGAPFQWDCLSLLLERPDIPSTRVI